MTITKAIFVSEIYAINVRLGLLPERGRKSEQLARFKGIAVAQF
jgi:hypothetical protein